MTRKIPGDTAGGPPSLFSRQDASRKTAVALLIAVIVSMTVAAYWPVGANSFVSYDDGEYLYKNEIVRKGLTLEGVAWAFRTFHTGNWHPLTWLSHMLDTQLFGLDAGWHHRVGLALHCANAALLFLTLLAMTNAPWKCAFVAALFAVHPLHVESVAWAAERKDVLSTFFWLLATGAYVRYVRRGGAGRYLLVAAFFLMGLLAKPMLVTFPFTLLLLDFWPLRRIESLRAPADKAPASRADASVPFLVREKVPLLALSGLSCIVTYIAQTRGEAVVSLQMLPLGVRAANALLAYAAYLWKTAWPAGLAYFYPYAPGNLPLWKAAGAGLSLLLVSAAVLRQARRRPYLATGWFWYLGTLVPVIGIVQVGSQTMADRYSYVPLIGIFLMAIWGIAEWAESTEFRRRLACGLGAAALIALSAATRHQTGYWRNSETLFRHAIAATEGNFNAHYNLGLYRAAEGQRMEAVAHYREALRIFPDFPEAHNNLGRLYAEEGALEEAMAHYREGLGIRPDSAELNINMGIALFFRGMSEEACAHFRAALRTRPDSPEAHFNLGFALAESGRLEEAAGHYREVLRLRPDSWEAHRNLGIVLMREGRIEEAGMHLQEALRRNPADGPAAAAMAELEKARSPGR